MEKLIERLTEQPLDGVWQRAVIETREIPFDAEVLEACKQNYCGRYDKNWSCPPAVGKSAELKAKCLSYRRGFVFTTKHAVEDSFDIEGMNAARDVHGKTEESLLPLFSGTDCLVLGAGSCDLCKKCAYPDPCRRPGERKHSVESYGINVVELAKNIGLRYNNGVNTVTYFSMILF